MTWLEMALVALVVLGLCFGVYTLGRLVRYAIDHGYMFRGRTRWGGFDLRPGAADSPTAKLKEKRPPKKPPPVGGAKE